ncbi:hypothetical protein ZIOFF_073151 [Zingiber officinale]|uniref:Cullin N-terminal domain-containing protein n=1 Tax=Zingiber officinale TaxID=94328 RepID=A0A8J5ESJ6_ZINOF|nr:hypothetical protein ZIOFF_073151 [Zingiber officinale]
MSMHERKTIDLEQGWEFMQKGITKLKNILEELPESQFSSEDYMMLYTTIYNMCTQKPPHDYSQQLYDKYRDSFEDYITSMPFMYRMLRSCGVVASLDKNLNSIGIWEYFKKKLKKQCNPIDIEEACDPLHQLKQMGSIRDHVKDISLFLLEIDDMIDKDSLFYFMDGLKE